MATAELEENAKTFPLDGNLIAGRYRRHGRIGSGRIGDIFEADDVDRQLGGGRSRIALQIIPEPVVRNKRLFNQLNAGYSLLRASPHPNIVEYLRFGGHGQSGYLAMELLNGISLLAVLKDATCLPLHEARPIMRGIGDALRHLHDRDFVHGNLTTKNVFVTFDFEVRLLDVLPIDPANSQIRGLFAHDPFSRCTAKDDVFGLACLTYEMLSGQHPFGHASATDARSAGLEPERIKALGDSEWDALRRALSFDDSERTATVEEFLRDLRVGATDRLCAVYDGPQTQKPIERTAARPQATAPGMAHFHTTTPPAPAGVPALHGDERPRKKRPARRTAHPFRLLALSLLLAAIGAWSYFGQAREQVLALLRFVDENTSVRITAPLSEVSTTAASVAADAPDAAVAGDDPVAASPAAGDAAVDIEPLSPSSSTTGVEQAALPAEDEPAETPTPSRDQTPPAGAADEALTVAPASAPNPAAADEIAVTAGAEPAPAEGGTDAAATEPEMPFPPSVLSVSEGSGTVRIAAGSAAIQGTRMVWWTSENTAKAGDDFITVERQFDAGRSAEDGVVVHVPLVNDSLPEPTESFYVNLGRYDATLGRIESVATVRVNIIDDDGI